MLDVVVVNWNAGAQLRECVASVLASRWQGIELGTFVVVDNASSDGSADDLQNVTVIRNAVNEGFAAACNRGARFGTGTYLLFLNPDTRVGPTTLATVAAQFTAAGVTRLGVVGVQLVDANGEIARSCARFPTASDFLGKALGLERLGLTRGYMMADWPHDRTQTVDHVMGAFYWVRRSLFEQLGGFDERFFVYLEDLDFSLRTRRAGWQTRFLAEARAYHKGGGTSEQIRGRRLAYALASRLAYARKHFDAVPASAVVLVTLVVEPAVRLAWALVTCSREQVAATVEAFHLLWLGDTR